jgi:hypothetical protein
MKSLYERAECYLLHEPVRPAKRFVTTGVVILDAIQEIPGHENKTTTENLSSQHKWHWTKGNANLRVGEI